MNEFQKQMLMNEAIVIRRALYGLAVSANEQDSLELNAIISAMTSLINTVHICTQDEPEIETKQDNIH